MTTAIVWPASLPCFRFEPYNVAPRPGATEMTLGMVTRRAQVYLENNELVSVEMILSAADEQTLRTFFKTTTVMGTQSFLVDLLMAGTLEPREATFYGAPPTFTPVAPGVVRTAFMLLAKRTPYSIVYELIATDYVNINAINFDLSASQPSVPGGTIVTISALATDRIVITKPSIASNPALTWNAHSRYDEDDANPPGNGLTWFNAFLVSDQADAVVYSFSGAAAQATAAASQVAANALMPINLTGSTDYQFWYWDSPVSDNRGGLSLKVETYRPVIT